MDGFISQGGGLKVALSFLSLTFSRPFIYLSTLAVYTPSPPPSPHLSALLVMYAVPDLPWTLSLSSCPAGMRDSHQTNQMAGVLLGSGVLDLDLTPRPSW